MGVLAHPRTTTSLTCLVPSSTVCWFSDGHRCLPSGDSTEVMSHPTCIEHDTDPGNFGEGCTITAHERTFTAVAPRKWPQTSCRSPALHNPRSSRWGKVVRSCANAVISAPLSCRRWTCRVIPTEHDACVPGPFVYNEATQLTAEPTALHHPGEEKPYGRAH
jgi:hypothetical protein